jgi:hypothetical protein
MSDKKKFNSKLYYIENREKILSYNRQYFKTYYQKKKMEKIFNNSNNIIEYHLRPNTIIIEKNVRVTF